MSLYADAWEANNRSLTGGTVAADDLRKEERKHMEDRVVPVRPTLLRQDVLTIRADFRRCIEEHSRHPDVVPIAEAGHHDLVR